MNLTDCPILLRPKAVTVFFILFVLAAVTSGSLWLDEAVVAYLASLPTMGQWWHYIVNSQMTDVQMPLYSVFIWAFVKVFGAGEYALRLGGTLWLVPGLIFFVLSFPQWKHRLAALVVLATNAFIWYYANEARSYSMQLGGSCMILAALNRLAWATDPPEAEGRWLGLFVFGLLTLCASSLLGMVWASAALGAAWVLFPAARLLGWWRRRPVLWILLTILLAALGCFYLWTLHKGSRGSDVGTTDWRTTLFIVYEHLGFAGLGPGRTELRAGGIRTLSAYLPVLAVYALALAIVLFHGLVELRRQSLRKLAGVSAMVVLPWLFLSAVGMASHFRLLGRHSAPLAVVWFLLMTIGLVAIARKPGWIAKAPAAIFLALSLCSAMMVRFDYAHSKDDYRKAAKLALTALSSGRIVWWNASDAGAWYYHLPLSESQPAPTKALLVENLPDETLSGWQEPQCVIASKPDLYDKSGSLARYLTNHHFQVVESFPAFNIWEPSQPKP